MKVSELSEREVVQLEVGSESGDLKFKSLQRELPCSTVSDSKPLPVVGLEFNPYSCHHHHSAICSQSIASESDAEGKRHCMNPQTWV